MVLLVCRDRRWVFCNIVVERLAMVVGDVFVGRVGGFLPGMVGGRVIGEGFEGGDLEVAFVEDGEQTVALVE